MNQEVKVDAEELDEDEEVKREERREKQRLANSAIRVCRNLAVAFEGCGPEMSDMDASDFKDRATDTWAAIKAARDVMQEQRRLRDEA